MLRELHIQNLAIIEDVTVSFREGLNCFTGQTGAGKSLILGAFEVLLGLRTAGDLLREGAEEGRVSGVFELQDEAVIREVESIADVKLEGDPLLITRKLFASGRSSVNVNGQPATTGMLKAVGELLVDVHGQHDHQFLLKPGNQLLMLDRYAGCEAEREAFAKVYGQLRGLRERREALKASQTLRRQQLELYMFQAEEIDAAELMEGEYEELNARLRLLSNLKRIHNECGVVHGALYEADGAVIEQLQAMVGMMMGLSELDEDLKPVLEDLQGATAQLQDVAFTVSRYMGRLNLDGDEVVEVEERLNVLNRLVHKYASAGGSVEDVMGYREEIGELIEGLEGEDEDLTAIDDQMGPLEEELRELGAVLREKRQAGAVGLVPLVEEELAELGMEQAKLEVSFGELKMDEVGEVKSPSGFDAVEMMVQTNPGQPMRPLRKVASGGEMSRMMLALKSILAQSDRISVLVFDEIDANIGGRMGTVIGGKLCELARHHQVLCITHLPQIAAYGDHHLRITKAVDGGETRTKVVAMEGEDRIEELAEMLTGMTKSATTRKQAEELLGMAEEVKGGEKKKKAEVVVKGKGKKVKK